VCKAQPYFFSRKNGEPGSWKFLSGDEEIIPDHQTGLNACFLIVQDAGMTVPSRGRAKIQQNFMCDHKYNCCRFFSMCARHSHIFSVEKMASRVRSEYVELRKTFDSFYELCDVKTEKVYSSCPPCRRGR